MLLIGVLTIAISIVTTFALCKVSKDPDILIEEILQRRNENFIL